MKKVCLLLTLFFGITLIGNSQTVKIGSQLWTTKNLNVSTFRNGDPITEAKTDEEWKLAAKNKQAAWCYYNNDAANGTQYGKLYNWYAVNDARGLAPAGYHIPSDAEWKKLSDYLGGERVAGKKMKSKSGWNYNGNGTNKGGFSGLPGGGCYSFGGFYYIGDYGYWWSSTETNKLSAFICNLYFYNSDASIIDKNKGDGLSVRCIRD